MKIIYDTDNDCVGCPQGCIHCGRGWYRYAIGIVCDKCGKSVGTVYDTADGYLCSKCILEDFDKVSIEDIDENADSYEDEDWINVKGKNEKNKECKR